jgi:hypothetical protein
MGMHPDDFQSLYRRYAYLLYREVFEELKNVEETREVVYQIFTRIREEEDLSGEGIEARLGKYRAEIVAQRKKARLDLDRVWYRMQNDEILGRPAGQPAESRERETGAAGRLDEPASREEAETPEEPAQAETEMISGQGLETPAQSETETVPEPRRARRVREVFPEEAEEQNAPKNGREKSLAGYWILLGIIVLLFLWFFLNILMTLGVVPVMDLGYSWFNGHVVTLFPVP